MSLISFSQLQDGVTGVNAAATNTPLNTIYNDYNGNITDANIASNAAIASTKLAGGNTGMFAAWQSWTPSWTNLTVGNGVNASVYCQVGKTVFFRVFFTLGSTSAVGSTPFFSLPVTAQGTGYRDSDALGLATLFDTSAPANFAGFVNFRSTTTAYPLTSSVSGSNITYSGIGVSTPFAWAVGDVIFCQGMYEAA